MMIKKKMILVFLMMVILPIGIFPVTTLLINANLVNILEEELNKKDEPLKAIGALSFYNEVFMTFIENPQLLFESNFYQMLFNKNPELTHLSVQKDNTVIFAIDKRLPPELPKEAFQQSHYVLEVEGKTLTYDLTYSPIFSKIPDVRIRNMVAGFGLAGIALYLSFSFFFVLYVLKIFLPPIDQLKKVANQISRKDYNIDIDITRKDEIGEAFQAFDHMRNSIQTYESNRKDFIANISHDLKTPITSIKGYITAIQDGMATTPEKMEKYVGVILNNTLHMEQLVDDLFLYSKLDVDQIEFDFKPVELGKYMDYLLDDIRMELEPQGITVDWQPLAEKGVLCSIDAFKMQRVINNIVSNAVKHFDKTEKTLQIQLSKASHTLMLTITDNGEGIPESEVSQVFDRFYRGDSSRNTATGSTGLGLAICQQIVEKHHGTISAHSKQHEGTTITIELPII